MELEEDSATRVEVWPVAMPYWTAFWLLSESRGISGGMAAMPLGLLYSEIVCYANEHGYEGEDRRELIQLVMAMDRVFKAHHYEKLAKEAKRKPRT